MDRDLLRHYLYQRRPRAIDRSEQSLPGARFDRLTQTPAAQALALARYRIEARDGTSYDDVRADYDATPGY